MLQCLVVPNVLQRFISCCAAGRVCRHVAAGIRVNMVVALADLASRFPNVLEPWTDHIYQTLAGERCLTLIQTGTSAPLPYTAPSPVCMLVAGSELFMLNNTEYSSRALLVFCLQH